MGVWGDSPNHQNLNCQNLGAKSKSPKLQGLSSRVVQGEWMLRPTGRADCQGDPRAILGIGGEKAGS